MSARYAIVGFKSQRYLLSAIRRQVESHLRPAFCPDILQVLIGILRIGGDIRGWDQARRESIGPRRCGVKRAPISGQKIGRRSTSDHAAGGADDRAGHRLLIGRVRAVLQHHGVGIGHRIREARRAGGNIDQITEPPDIAALQATGRHPGGRRTRRSGLVVCLRIGYGGTAQQNGILVAKAIDGWDRWETTKWVGALAGNHLNAVYRRKVVFRKGRSADRSNRRRLAGIIYRDDRAGPVTRLIVAGIGFPMGQRTGGEIDVDGTGLGLCHGE